MLKTRKVDESVLSAKQQQALRELARRGVILPDFRLNIPKTYRELARPKQLPPDDPRYSKLLEATGELDKVRVVEKFFDEMTGRDSFRTRPTHSGEMFEDWFLWFLRCGRGFGKSWTGGNWINEGAWAATGQYMALIGRDADDVRAFMIEGDSGIMATAKPGFIPEYQPSKKKVVWPNGVEARIYYAEKPDTVRGPNNFRAWADEPASWADAHLGIWPEDGTSTAMSNLLLTLRKGKPQLCVTGTPRPVKLIKDLMTFEGAVIVNGGTRENRPNLAEQFFVNVVNRFEGTRLGRQEIDGEILDDNPDAAFHRKDIEKGRLKAMPAEVLLEAIMIGVDPQMADNDETGRRKKTAAATAETGIIAAGREWRENEKRYHYYIFEDASLKGSPREWGVKVIQTYRKWRADMIIAERNNGGALVKGNMLAIDPNAPVDDVWASRGKLTRAGPIANLYEQGRVHHIGSYRDYVELETQMCEWQPGMPSPDRMDALVWVLSKLQESEVQEWLGTPSDQLMTIEELMETPEENGLGDQDWTKLW